MIQLSRNDKKLLILLIILFICIFLFIFVEFCINALNSSRILEGNKTSEGSNIITDTLSEFKNATKNTKPSMLRNDLDEIFNLMNNQNYEQLYSLLNEDFKENMFYNNFESFKAFMTGYADDIYTPSFSKYSSLDNTYMLLVSFIPSSNSDEDIIATKDPAKADTFIINDLGEGNFTFSFLGYVGEKELKTGKENSLFSVILDKTILYKTKSEFYFTITNKTDKPIEFSNKQLYCYTGINPRYYNSDVNILPNSSANLCFTVGTGLSIKNALPDQICFKDIIVGENPYSFNIKTGYCLNV